MSTPLPPLTFTGGAAGGGVNEGGSFGASVQNVTKTPSMFLIGSAVLMVGLFLWLKK